MVEARGAEADELRQQARDLRDRLRELEPFEADAKRVEALEADLRTARLDAEVLRRKLEALSEDATSRLDLLQKLEHASVRLAEADVLQKRVDALEARLFALDPTAGADHAPVAAAGSQSVPLQEAASQLVRAGAKASVLADSAGLPLASAGPAAHQESLSALSAVALDFAGRATAMLPIGTIRLVQLVDQHDMTVYWSLFDSHGERYSLAGVGPSLPDPALLQSATDSARSAVDRAGGNP